MHRNNKNYSIELCLAIFVIALLVSSCGTMVDMVATCPAYATVECENKNIN